MNKQEKLKIVECPRDAMQGWAHPISTERKISYINQLIKVGFDTLDCGSFVSPKAIPQMADTHQVIQKIDLGNSATKLLAIVANERGATDAVLYEQIAYLGYPFSVSETFQLRNTNATMKQSLERVEEMHNLCIKNNKELVVYLSMGFGNPYGDPYSEEIVFEWADQLAGIGINIISVADTVGLATAEQVQRVTGYLVNALPAVEIGVHLHSTIMGWQAKVAAALAAGCRRFDGALKGIGGCPMADDDLVGNMDTELVIPYVTAMGYATGTDSNELATSSRMAAGIFA